jgi:hypothetical protein
VSLRIAGALAVAVCVVGATMGAGVLRMPFASRTGNAPAARPLAAARSGLTIATFAPHTAEYRPLASGSPVPRRSRSVAAYRTPRAPALSVTPIVTRQAPATLSPSPSPSSPPATSPSPATSPAPALVPSPTAEYQTPKGSNELAWSEAILTELGDPITSANIISVGYWMQNEAGYPPYGIVGANNPVNVSEPGYGGTPIQSEGNGYYLYSYPTVTDGVAAIAAYLNRPSYQGILAALKAGAGLSSASLASEFSVYSGGGYTAVPDSWGASQGQPET